MLARDIKGKGGRTARDGIDELRAAGGREFYMAKKSRGLTADSEIIYRL